MASEQFSLCWDNFHKNMSSGMNSLLENEDLVDVTLAVEGKYLKAHKMVLSVCSPYFRELFKVNPCKHPIVFMKDVSYVAMSDLLQFMYQGEVQVSQENLTTFIKTAEALQIKGLTGDGNGSAECDNDQDEPKPTDVELPKPTPRPMKKVHQVPTPPAKRPRLSAPEPSVPPAVTKTEPAAVSSASNNDQLIQFKMEPYDQGQSTVTIPDDNADETFTDDPLDETNADDGNEDYSMMEGGDEEPQAGTSADGTAGEGQGFLGHATIKIEEDKTELVDESFHNLMQNIPTSVEQMSRKRLRTTTKAQWSAEDILKAIQDVNNGISQRKAAYKYGIPVSTFQQRIKTLGPGGPNVGRKAVFNKNQEADLASHMKTLADVHFGLTPVQLRQLAFEYAEKLHIPHTFNKTNRLAGKDWFYGFLKRNPSISVRKSEPRSLNRTKEFNKSEVGHFYNNLENVLNRYNFHPQKIYNMNETEIATGKNLASKGQRRDRGQTTTVICCMNAAGGFVPPMFIYPDQKMTPTLEVNGPHGAIYHCSKNGWTNEQLFLTWLKHFSKYALPTKEEPALLVIDNHSSHITLGAFEYCRDNNIVVLSTPPHTSHKLQPLEVVFYAPLKDAYNRECDLQMRSNPGEPITVDNLAEIFNRAYITVATVETGVSGFSRTGIYPVNRNIFSDEDFSVDSTRSSFQEVEVDESTDQEIGVDESMSQIIKNEVFF